MPNLLPYLDPHIQYTTENFSFFPFLAFFFFSFPCHHPNSAFGVSYLGCSRNLLMGIPTFLYSNPHCTVKLNKVCFCFCFKDSLTKVLLAINTLPTSQWPSWLCCFFVFQLHLPLSLIFTLYSRQLDILHSLNTTRHFPFHVFLILFPEPGMLPPPFLPSA